MLDSYLYSGVPALHDAVRKNRTAEFGKYNPLLVAVVAGDLPRAELLLDHGASIQTMRENLLVEAIYGQADEQTTLLMLQMLLRRGADMTRGGVGKGGVAVSYGTALEAAFDVESMAAARLLIAAGAPIYTTDFPRPCFAGVLDTKCYEGENVAIIELMLNVTGISGSWLGDALSNLITGFGGFIFKRRVIALLVGQGLDIKADVFYRVSALHLACGHGYTEFYEAFVRIVDPRLIRFLLEKGADVNARDWDGRTALHVLCDARNAIPDGFFVPDEAVEAAEVLLARGADAQLRDNAGNRAIDLAWLADREDLVRLLAANQAPLLTH